MKKLLLPTATTVLALTLVAIQSCTSNENFTDDSAITEQTLSLNGNCDFYTIANGENADWQITDCPAWVTPVKEAGSATDAIRLYVEELSTGAAERQGTIQVRFANGVTRTVDAAQTSRASDMISTSQRSYAAGWSFDVRTYSDSRGIRNQIFNIQKMVNDAADNYQTAPYTGEQIDSYYGEDATSLQESISAKAKLGGEYNSFSGEISGNFGRSTLSDSRRIFSWMRTRISVVTAFIKETSPSKLQSANWFTQDFQGIRDNIIQAVKNNDSNLDAIIRQLVDSYGTHVILASRLGGSYDYYYSTVLTKEMSTDSLSGALQASFKEKFNLKGDVSYVSALEESASETVEKFLVKGGDAMQLARSVELKDDPEAVSKWIKTIVDGKYELVDYDLVPISMFFPAAASDKIEEYIEKLYYDEMPLTRTK